MAQEDVQSNLYALRKLYGLLQNCGRTVQMQNTHLENLDDKARLLLKDLLDCAIESVFETPSKTIDAAEKLHELKPTSCSCSSSTLEEKCKSTPPHVSSVAASPNVVNGRKDYENSNRQNLFTCQINGGQAVASSCTNFSNPMKTNNVTTSDKIHDFDEQVARAIEWIESRISALPPSQILSQRRSRISAMSSKTTSQKKIQLLCRLASQKKNFQASQTDEYVQGFRVPQTDGIRGSTVKISTDPSERPSSSMHSIGPRQNYLRKSLDQTDQKRSGILKKYNQTGPRNHVLPRHQESDETSSSISPNPSSSSASSASASSDYSLPARTGPSHSMGPTQRRLGHMTSHNYLDESSSSSDAKTHKSGRRMNNEKSIGRLKRLKNKLSLIFHHHHHDHSYENDGQDDGRTKSRWKHLHNVFHRTEQHDINRQQALGKPRKSTVQNVARKQTRGQFNVLVEGVFRHVRHQKKLKSSKGKMIGRSENVPRRPNKKVVKRLHWWQMLRRHGGVKLPNRGRVKLGLDKGKKSRLKAT